MQSSSGLKLMQSSSGFDVGVGVVLSHTRRHRGSTCGRSRWVLRTEAELRDHHLVRLLRILSTRSIILKAMTMTSRTSTVTTAATMYRVASRSRHQSIEILVPVRSHVYGSTLDCLACLLVSTNVLNSRLRHLAFYVPKQAIVNYSGL